MTQFHLAQINIGRAIAELDEPVMASFIDGQDRINALADASSGFVWRLQDESGDPMALGTSDDPRVVVNMSVWETLDHLKDFVYRIGHAAVMGRRREWFEPHEEAYLALWWIVAGEVPTEDEGMARLDHIWGHGPSAHAFDFKTIPPIPISEKAG